jgi:hypothetical protein
MHFVMYNIKINSSFFTTENGLNIPKSIKDYYFQPQKSRFVTSWLQSTRQKSITPANSLKI